MNNRLFFARSLQTFYGSSTEHAASNLNQRTKASFVNSDGCDKMVSPSSTEYAASNLNQRTKASRLFKLRRLRQRWCHRLLRNMQQAVSISELRRPLQTSTAATTRLAPNKRFHSASQWLCTCVMNLCTEISLPSSDNNSKK